VRWVRLTEPVISGRLIDGRKFGLARIGGRQRTSRMIDENVNEEIMKQIGRRE
jgi:hypothetical protein